MRMHVLMRLLKAHEEGKTVNIVQLGFRAEEFYFVIIFVIKMNRIYVGKTFKGP